MERHGFTTPVIATMSLRAPRVALLIPVEREWQLFAMHAIHDFCLTWGGFGFVVVPVEQEGIHPALLQALREYDPDAVLMPEFGFIDESHRATLTGALEAISANCSNYRMPLLADTFVASPSQSDLWQSIYSHGGPGSGLPNLLANVADFPTDSTYIAVSPGVGGSLGLAAASRWGLKDPPSAGQDAAPDTARRLAARRLAGYEYDATNLLGVTDQADFKGDYATAFARTLVGLDGAQRHGPDRAETLVVWGDAPTDFALAMVWDRTYRMGVWLPDEWWKDDTLRAFVALGLDDLARITRRNLRRLVFTSSSLSPAELEDRVDSWLSELGTSSSAGEKYRSNREIRDARNLPFTRDWKTHFVLRENLHHQWSTNVYDSAGSIEFAMLPRVPVISVSGLEKLESQANWQVDIAVENEHALPSAVAIPERSLLAGGDGARATRIRSGRYGISYEAYRTDFIPTGATLTQALTRPLPRFPSLLAWADARVSAFGASVRPSTAGIQASILSSMMDGRDVLSELIAGDLLAAMKAFLAETSTKKDFPDQAGCVVNHEGFLHFQGICKRAGIPVDETARDRVDKLLRAGILRRGLLLQCPVCHHAAFVLIDELANIVRCRRCNAPNPLKRALWKDPVDEPVWYYDLHPTMRGLLIQNGDVPLLLSHYLRTSAKRQFVDAQEFEMFDADGKPQIETDLLALADLQLSVAEAKCTDNLGSNAEARKKAAFKRVLAAAVLKADEIILATTADSWKPSTLGVMESAVKNASWEAGRPPRLRIITRLGTGSVLDQLVPLT